MRLSAKAAHNSSSFSYLQQLNQTVKYFLLLIFEGIYIRIALILFSKEYGSKFSSLLFSSFPLFCENFSSMEEKRVSSLEIRGFNSGRPAFFLFKNRYFQNSLIDISHIFPFSISSFNCFMKEDLPHPHCPSIERVIGGFVPSEVRNSAIAST
ncbi:hypothetical protein MSBRM_3170 [Methanosarcina barkeri MS]|uniref:Uncharacterized protein n=1 Tax=Methanosarcina barkeri MS TaxID=1434108 RepID=A0A0E3QYZ5_METBA|nr:hypothetical protein MSBRM_3170 [Methanosarcina barkeri MS]